MSSAGSVVDRKIDKIRMGNDERYESMLSAPQKIRLIPNSAPNIIFSGNEQVNFDFELSGAIPKSKISYLIAKLTTGALSGARVDLSGLFTSLYSFINQTAVNGRCTDYPSVLALYTTMLSYSAQAGDRSDWTPVPLAGSMIQVAAGSSCWIAVPLLVPGMYDNSGIIPNFLIKQRLTFVANTLANFATPLANAAYTVTMSDYYISTEVASVRDPKIADEMRSLVRQAIFSYQCPVFESAVVNSATTLGGGAAINGSTTRTTGFSPSVRYVFSRLVPNGTAAQVYGTGVVKTCNSPTLGCTQFQIFLNGSAVYPVPMAVGQNVGLAQAQTAVSTADPLGYKTLCSQLKSAKEYLALDDEYYILGLANYTYSPLITTTDQYERFNTFWMPVQVCSVTNEAEVFDGSSIYDLQHQLNFDGVAYSNGNNGVNITSYSVASVVIANRNLMLGLSSAAETL